MAIIKVERTVIKNSHKTLLSEILFDHTFEDETDDNDKEVLMTIMMMVKVLRLVKYV